MRKADLVTGAGLALGAVAFSAAALKYYAWWGDSGPGPAFLPFWLGAVMVVLASSLAIRSIREKSAETAWLPTGKPAQRVLVIIGATLALFVLLKAVGMVAATALYLAFLMRYLERKPWWMVAVVSAGAAAFNWLVFAHYLHVPFPEAWLWTF